MQKHIFKTLITGSQHLMLSCSHTLPLTLSLLSQTHSLALSPLSHTCFSPFSFFSLLIFFPSLSLSVSFFFPNLFFTLKTQCFYCFFTPHCTTTTSLSLFALSYQTQCWFCTRVSGNAESLVNLCTFFIAVLVILGFVLSTQVMGKNVLVLGLTLLVLFGAVSSASTSASPASEYWV